MALDRPRRRSRQSGGHNRLPPAARAQLPEGVGDIIDAAGDRFTMRYAAMAVTAQRR